MMLRKLMSVTAGLTAGLMVISAFAQTPPKKKKKKKPKHTTTAPAATPKAAPAPAPAEPPTPPPEETTTPPASTSPETPPATEGETSATPPAEKEKETPAESPSPPPWSASLLAGWGYNDAAKLGFGGRVGYTLPFHVYLGGTFIYHLGEQQGGASSNFFYGGGEVGYEIWLGSSFLLRPYAGVGPVLLAQTAPGASLTTTYFGVWPGLAATYSFTPAFFAGLDGRVVVNGYPFFDLFVDVGLRF